MRDIKFRGKRKLNGDWVYGSYVHVGNDWCQIVTKADSDDIIEKVRVITDSVGQYTSIKDKNGKEIYEGDIVSYTVEIGEQNETSVGHYNESFIEEVSFVDAVFCVDGYAPVSAFNENMEVIGNIFENPELLKP